MCTFVNKKIYGASYVLQWCLVLKVRLGHLSKRIRMQVMHFDGSLLLFTYEGIHCKQHPENLEVPEYRFRKQLKFECNGTAAAEEFISIVRITTAIFFQWLLLSKVQCDFFTLHA